ncbi:MAG: hypothetical protein MI919_09705 [Holophagales bacterium]|nr:hypothetical protein [Holophagales bacterium]
MVGGWQTQQQNCGHSDLTQPDSECNVCGTGISGCNDYHCARVANCQSGNPCPDPTLISPPC